MGKESNESLKAKRQLSRGRMEMERNEGEKRKMGKIKRNNNDTGDSTLFP